MTWLRFFAFILFLWLIARPLRAKEPSPAEVEQIQKIIRNYLSQHPEVILDVLKQYQDRQAAENVEKTGAAIASLGDELLQDKASPVGGNLEGDVTIVEFFDYRCPYCKAVAPDFAKVVAADGKVRVVYKEFPILGPSSVTAAKAALAAERQGKYVAFHDRLLAYRGNLDDAAIFSVAGDVGLDIVRLKTDMERSEIQGQIDRNYRLADKLNIQGTPAFIIGRELLPGVASGEEFVAAIKQARGG